MKHQPKVVSSPISGFRLDPTFASEEAIILRALLGGKTDKQVCDLLRMSSDLFLRLMRDLREQTGTTSNLSLLVWAQRRLKSVTGEWWTGKKDMPVLPELQESPNIGAEAEGNLGLIAQDNIQQGIIDV
jgi:DNA-binding CsgD family transcriptional regulator